MRLYLDNAATSWPKPEVVYQAVDRYQRELGAAAGRGSYRSARQAERIVNEARNACAAVLGVSDPRQLVFTSNGTAALNLAIHGLLKPGDHVVTTVCEHNSVLRPLQWQVENNGVQVTHVGCDLSGYVDPDEISQALTPKTRLVAVTHASNVTGAVQPITDVAQLAHDAGSLLLVDAAQTAGCVPIDLGSLDVDFLACGGHKGLLGPLGTGLLYVRPGLEHVLSPREQGGTGISSREPSQPQQMPEKFESGNLSLPAIAGLGAAAQYLLQHGVAEVQKHHQQLAAQLLDRLGAIAGVRIYGPAASGSRVAVVSFSVEGYDPHEFAAGIDLIDHIECRAGLHCAPRIHAALGTADRGGLVRLSPGWATTQGELDRAMAAIAVAAENVPL